MTATQTTTKFDTYQALRTAVSLLSDSANAQDLCRRVTHTEHFKGMCRGVAIYLLDQKSALVQVAGYGDVPEDSQTQISAWDDNFIATSVRSRSVSYEMGAASIHSCLPIEVAGVITGVMYFTFSTEYEKPNPDRDDTKMLANLAGLFMDTKGVSFTPRVGSPIAAAASEEISVQELTTRQVQILHYVADGLTNAEISKHVLLSESTVRQETIRIFRILKCHTRSEAIVKARATGIIARVPKVSELVAETA
jgi:DNA-binding CsgD family transcriptional regulator